MFFICTTAQVSTLKIVKSSTKMKKSSHDWFKEPEYKDIVTLDPDGWDRMNYEVSMNEPITREEFESRCMQSTQYLMEQN